MRTTYCSTPTVAAVEHTRWTTTYQRILSATVIGGALVLRSFKSILRLGVWLRTQIANEIKIGREAGQKFCRHEQQVAQRRKLARTK